MSSVADKTSSSNGVARLKLGDRETDLPIIVGTEDERAIDISKLRAQTGFITLDEGYVNTGATTSAHHLSRRRKRHSALSRLPDRSAGREVRLCRNELPADLRRAAQSRTAREVPHVAPRHTMLHEDMRSFYNGFPRDAHPMAILGSVVGRPFDLLSGLARPARSRAGARFRSTG